MNEELLSVHIVDFKQHLKRLGYGESIQNMLPVCVAEFLSWNNHKPLQEITATDIVRYYDYISERTNKRRVGGLSSIMIHHHIYSIRVFLNYHEQTGTIQENPISGLVFPKAESNEREVLSIQEIKQLYEAAETYRERVIIGIFYGCGLRRSEGEMLNLKDISLRDSLLYVREGKGNKRRVVPINQRVAEDFKNYLYEERFAIENETAFICNHKGHRITGGSCNRILKALIKKAAIQKKISLHCLRHSIATHLVENGMSVEYVRDFLGHKHLDATQIYTRISKRRLQEV